MEESRHNSAATELAGTDQKQPHRVRRTRWVTRLTIEAFRGIPGILEIDLSDESRPSGAVILGDNGSGKSSIVDALQFGLQAEIQGLGGNKAAAFARSHSVEKLPRVSVALSDGTVIERKIELEAEPEEVLRFDRAPFEEFSRTPMVLRRSDILRFWETAPEERQLIFVRYFRTSGSRTRETPKERIEHLEAERIRDKSNRTDALHKLAQEAGVPRDSIPADLGKFNHWVNNHFFGGYNLQTHRFRNKRKLPRPQWLAINDARHAIKTLRATERKLIAVKEQASQARSVPELAQVLEEASVVVTDAFHAISSHTGVKSFDIRIGAGSAVALSIDVELTNGSKVDPKTVLSEANRDLVALLIFVAIAKAAAARGRAKVMVLDDVFQSVDSPIRLATLDYLVRDLRDWQFVITAHDRLWREQVKGVLQRHNVPVNSLAITDWTFNHGPVVQATQGDLGLALREALGKGDAADVALRAGRLLEQVCDVLSWTLEISVTRRAGDRYTLGDLWPPVRKALSRTDAVTSIDEVERYLHLRNLIGAHPNQWAESASLAEVRRFGEGVLSLLNHVWCDHCHRWIERSPARGHWICRCGSTVLTRRQVAS